MVENRAQGYDNGVASRLRGGRAENMKWEEENAGNLLKSPYLYFGPKLKVLEIEGSNCNSESGVYM